mgnify:CR=1 FL=1
MCTLEVVTSRDETLSRNKKEPKCTQIVETTPVQVSTPMLRHRFCLAVNVETIPLGATMLFLHFPQDIIMVFHAYSPNSGDCT